MSKKQNKRLASEKPPGDVFHPGEFIRDELESRDMSQKELAEKLDVSKSEMSLILNGHRNLTPAIAIKLEKAWGTDAEFWMNLQIRYEIDQLRKKYKKQLQNTRISDKRKSKFRKVIAAA